VLFEDSAAMLGIAIAFIGTFAADRLGMPVLDGVAAIGISLVLAATAVMLARESKELLIGEPASARVTASIVDIARKQPGVERANVVFTVHLAPDQIVAALSVEFSDNLTTPQIEERIAALERAISDAHPDVIAVFVKPQTARAYQSFRRRLMEEAVAADGNSG
jgi:divalent metal cation (Fe/Co/Zn/Cd) transporter